MKNVISLFVALVLFSLAVGINAQGKGNKAMKSVSDSALIEKLASKSEKVANEALGLNCWERLVQDPACGCSSSEYRRNAGKDLLWLERSAGNPSINSC
jgi:hypothetical protein